MNPHRYSWGPAYNFQFVAIAAVVTILGFLISSEKKKLPRDIITILLVFLVIWVTVTTFTSLNPPGAKAEWERFVKIQILNFLALFMIHNRKRLNWLIAVVAGSIGFFAFKGGIFTIMTGGIYQVGGPAESFITGNTEIGFASVVILPLIYYLATIMNRKLLKYSLLGAICLCIVGIIGTYSRGAFVALGILCAYFWLISQRKLLVLIILLFLVPSVYNIMPDKYFERMETIKTYEEDNSALGRINAWRFAINLTKDRPIFGGGANAFIPELFERYAPEPQNVHDAHSIYFEMLGEQGYPGLLIFLAILFFSFRNCAVARRKAKGNPTLNWAVNLSRMLQASFVAYAVGGAFLGLSYFDLLYHLVALTVLLRLIVEKELQSDAALITDQATEHATITETYSAVPA